MLLKSPRDGQNSAKIVEGVRGLKSLRTTDIWVDYAITLGTVPRQMLINYANGVFSANLATWSKMSVGPIVPIYTPS